MTSLLQGAVERGTAKGGRVPGWQVAAKTGTTQDAADLWFVGYTPTLAAGLWVGYDQPRRSGRMRPPAAWPRPCGPTSCGGLSRDAERDAADPEGILPVRVNYRTGLPTDPGDPNGITEYFIRGALPEREALSVGVPAGPQSPPPPAATTGAWSGPRTAAQPQPTVQSPASPSPLPWLSRPPVTPPPPSRTRPPTIPPPRLRTAPAPADKAALVVNYLRWKWNAVAMEATALVYACKL